jgi:hypothetical protein
VQHGLAVLQRRSVEDDRECPKVIAMPTEPISNNGLQPKRLMLAIAMKVVAMFTTLVITVIELLSLTRPPATARWRNRRSH